MDMMDGIDGWIRIMGMMDGMDGMEGEDGWMDIIDRRMNGWM